MSEVTKVESAVQAEVAKAKGVVQGDVSAAEAKIAAQIGGVRSNVRAEEAKVAAEASSFIPSLMWFAAGVLVGALLAKFVFGI